MFAHICQILLNFHIFPSFFMFNFLAAMFWHFEEMHLRLLSSNFTLNPIQSILQRYTLKTNWRLWREQMHLQSFLRMDLRLPTLIESTKATYLKLSKKSLMRKMPKLVAKIIQQSCFQHLMTVIRTTPGIGLKSICQTLYQFGPQGA